MINVLGIINYDDASVHVAGLENYRPIPSLSFLARYRLIDFALSNMTNSGIKRIQVYVKHKPRSIIEHLGSGRQYNINSKHGKLRILTGEETIQSEAYNHDITAFLQNMRFIEDANQEYVMIIPSHMIYTVDFKEVFKQHIDTKADATANSGSDPPFSPTNSTKSPPFESIKSIRYIDLANTSLKKLLFSISLAS